jgi:hypothetical protein
MLGKLVSLLLAGTTTACVTMRPVSAPASFIPAHRPQHVRIIARGQVMLLSQPRLIGDTLTGWAHGEYQELLLSDVQRVEAPQPAPVRTVLVVTAAAAGVATLIISTRGSGPVVDPGIEYRRSGR